MPISISQYLNDMGKQTGQWNKNNYNDPDRQRIYLKDINCPKLWHDKLKEQIPPCCFYLNESTRELGSPRSVGDPNLSEPGTIKGTGVAGTGVARTGDLMSCLPTAMRAENLMCYIGHEGTYAPAHREICASLGQNIMVEASGTVDEHGERCEPGSSIWFMTETKERHLVSEYWLSTLGHDIEMESHFAQIDAWKEAPFKTYVVEQNVGDFVLIPPLAPHQVWNRGTRTINIAWNRTTVETLEMAMNEALPRARIVCRGKQYKTKAIVMFALERYSNLLKLVDTEKQTPVDRQDKPDPTYSLKVRQVQIDFRRLFSLFSEIMLSEMLPPIAAKEKRVQYLPYDSYVTCSYCRCNIFNRFLICTSCTVPLENGEEDTYDICMECYVMGRSCKCISRYIWVEQFLWQDLVQKHERWRLQILGFDGNRVTEKSPKSLELQRKDKTNKALAQVCYEQLKIRPWCDPEKNQENSLEKSPLEDDRVNADDTTRKPWNRIRRSEKFPQETARCHISRQLEPRWKVAICECGRGYHYESLFRAFDVMPLTVMEDPGWKCPYCLKICSCAQCRELPGMRPFEPKGTMLGRDTSKVTDPRSVESLVDFSHSNFRWIKKARDSNYREVNRLLRRKDKAVLDRFKPVNGKFERTRQSNRRSEVAQHGHLRNPYSPSDNGRPSGLTAPAAMMVDHGPGTQPTQDKSGVNYQCPGSTLPQSVPSPWTKRRGAPPKTAQYNGPQASVRGKRHEAQNTVQDDPFFSHQNNTHEKYHHTRMQRKLSEAKCSDRFINAEAAITGKTLRLVLPIDGIKLAEIAAKYSNAPQVQGRLEGDSVKNGKTVTASPNVPSVPLTDFSQSNGSMKKRKLRVDEKEYLSTSGATADLSLLGPGETAVHADSVAKLAKENRKAKMNVPSDTSKASFSYGNDLVNGRRTLTNKLRRCRNLPTNLAPKNNSLSQGDSSAGSPWDHSRQKTLPRSRMREANPPETPVKDASASPLDSLLPIVSFQARPLPESDVTVDLSMLGPGETTVRAVAGAKKK